MKFKIFSNIKIKLKKYYFFISLEIIFNVSMDLINENKAFVVSNIFLTD